jgi:hypothetical protein
MPRIAPNAFSLTPFAAVYNHITMQSTPRRRHFRDSSALHEAPSPHTRRHYPSGDCSGQMSSWSIVTLQYFLRLNNARDFLDCSAVCNPSFGPSLRHQHISALFGNRYFTTAPSHSRCLYSTLPWILHLHSTHPTFAAEWRHIGPM